MRRQGRLYSTIYSTAKADESLRVVRSVQSVERFHFKSILAAVDFVVVSEPATRAGSLDFRMVSFRRAYAPLEKQASVVCDSRDSRSSECIHRSGSSALPLCTSERSTPIEQPTRRKAVYGSRIPLPRLRRQGVNCGGLEGVNGPAVLQRLACMCLLANGE